MKMWFNCTHQERIERWENCLRVLSALSPHERRQHWDMASYGVKAKCGTIACAAGHCGMDPWFRRRGLLLRFHFDRATGWSHMMYGGYVRDFFGRIGSGYIFFNTTPRSVQKVIREVKNYIKFLKADTEFAEGAPEDSLPPLEIS